MKFTGLILFLVLLSGCTKRIVVVVPQGATAEQIQAAEKAAVEKEKKNAPAQKAETQKAEAKKKAEEQRAKAAQKAAETRENWAKQQARWKQQFALSCPMGGYDKVIIHPALGSQYLYWKGGGSMKVIFRRYVMVHRVKNPYTNIAPDITNGGERVISGLCPGGSITLVASIPPITGGRSMNVIWTAEGIVDGRLAYDESSPGHIWQGGYNWEAQMNRPSWVIRLNRVDRRF